MTFLNVMKCVFCLRWSCPKRYQIGNRTYYSYLGFVRTECPKKTKNYSFLTMDEIREKAKKEALERRKVDEEQQKSKVKNIVIVDDNVQFAETLLEFMKNDDKAEIVAFASPIAVKKHLATNQVDILVTDYEMPNMTGCELAKEVLEKYPNTSIIIMSGHDISYINEVCKKYGIEGKVKTVCKSNIDYFSELI